MDINLKNKLTFFKGSPLKNIIAIKKRESQNIIIVGAHYDSILGSPGADDNVFSVSGLLELAGLLSAKGGSASSGKEERLSKTIKFIAFTNEEPPFFLSSDMGNQVYARETKRKKREYKGNALFRIDWLLF